METMRVWAMDALGQAALTLRSVARPSPTAREVLVKVSAVALNHRDKYMIESGMGSPLAFPFSPASDMAGTIVEIGENCNRFCVGDRVISNFMPGWIEGRVFGTARVPYYRALGGELPGVLAEYLVFPEEWLSRSPQTLSDAEASTLPVAGLTAWFSLVERGKLRAGQIVLVHGTGGVGLFGVQIAKMLGAEVIVTSGSDDKLARVKSLGANHGINRLTTDWVEAVYECTGDHGADHILELVGGANFGRSVKAVAVGGNIYVIGLLEGHDVSGPAVPILLKQPSIQGVAVGHRRSLEDFCRAIDLNGLKPVIARTFGFEQLPEALDALDHGPFGKIIVSVQ